MPGQGLPTCKIAIVLDLVGEGNLSAVEERTCTSLNDSIRYQSQCEQK